MCMVLCQVREGDKWYNILRKLHLDRWESSIHGSISEEFLPHMIFTETFRAPRVHFHNSADICFYSRMPHHMTSGTNLAKFTIPDNSPLKLHYYTRDLIIIIIIIIRSTVEKLEVVCRLRWAMPSLTFKVTLAIIEVSLWYWHITVWRLN